MRGEGKKLAQAARLQARGELHIPTEQDEHHDAQQADYAAALASFGLDQSEPDGAQPSEQKCYLWPENVRTFNIWQRLQTQWRCSAMGAATGLDYDAVWTYLREVAGLTRKAAKDMFPELQAMEAAVLDEWARQRA